MVYMENPINMDDSGVTPFMETPTGKEQSWKGVHQHRTEGHRREVDEDLRAARVLRASLEMVIFHFHQPFSCWWLRSAQD